MATEQFTDEDLRAYVEAGDGDAADWYHVDCDDPDLSQFFENLADAQTLVNEHGGEITPLFAGPMPYSAQQYMVLSRTLCELMRVLPAPKAKKAQSPYQTALLLALQIENRSDLEPLHTGVERRQPDMIAHEAGELIPQVTGARK